MKSKFLRGPEPAGTPTHARIVWFLIIINVAGILAALALAWRAPLVALALWLGPAALLTYQLFLLHAQGLVRMPCRFTTTKQEVWLTIDDGPDPEDTPRILALLKAHHARATFFVLGINATAYPELIRAITAGGHEVAHHTHTHPVRSFWCASPARVARELDAGLEALHAAGVTPTRFRPPVGFKNLWLAKALALRGLACIGWSARGLERQSADAEVAAARATRGLAPGAIILLHEGPRIPAPLRVSAIHRVLERLQEQGYRCVVPGSEQLRH